MHKLILLTIIGLIVNINFSFSQTKEIPKGYAVVVGAYSLNNTELALRFTNHVTSLGYEGRFGLNESKSLILVYIAHTESFKEAVVKMNELRKKENFTETWVHVKTSEARLELTPEQQAKAEKATDVMKEKVVVSLGDIYADKFKDVKADNEQDQNADIAPQSGAVVVVSAESDVAEEKQEAEVEPVVDNRLSVHFNLINATDGNPVVGELQVVDTERSKLLDVVTSGQFHKIDDPKNGTGQVTVIADVFGFRKLQKEFNYYNPYKGTTNADIDSSNLGVVINFDLVRYRKGDIIIMYNVFFFKDAAVMRPESDYEVKGLLTMMKENKKLNIKIHGHVNGNHPGEIISVDGNNFFKLTDNNPRAFGTSRELSKQRAELIKNYLIQEGISADRMEIKAWGGKRMLHDKHSNQARQNVRVEIEILED